MATTRSRERRRCQFCVFRPARKPLDSAALLASAGLFTGRVDGAPVTHRVKWRATTLGTLWIAGRQVPLRPALTCVGCATVIAAGLFDDAYTVRAYRFRTVR